MTSNPTHRNMTGTSLRWWLLAAWVLALPVAAQETRYPGNLDVPYVPTHQATVDAMLRLAGVGPGDFVIDLGSGDGRTVITAAKRGVKSLGIEYEGEMVALARRNAQREGVADRAQFVQQDLFESDFSKATVITMFLLPEINLRLRPTILALKPGTRIVSNSFPMGDWEPDQRAELGQDKGCEAAWCTALMWIVPARVGGTHQVPQGELVLTQTFQMLSGTLRNGGAVIPVEGRVIGEEVVITAAGRELRGHVHGTRLMMGK